MRRWILYILAGLIGVIAIVAIVGAMLPKSHTASRAMRFRPQPAVLFGVVSDFAKYPEWRSDVRSMDVQGPVAVGSVIREHGPNGPIAYRIEVFEPPSKTTRDPSSSSRRTAKSTTRSFGSWRSSSSRPTRQSTRIWLI
jgi:hypothetical protein